MEKQKEDIGFLSEISESHNDFYLNRNAKILKIENKKHHWIPELFDCSNRLDISSQSAREFIMISVIRKQYITSLRYFRFV